ncbi:MULTISPECIES: DUF6297 family protein [unclassified Rhodococcus (in: high G+C Gram-positive bacteria)]|uniref:DUF6297 family protein n=1 Tax=unclassified Rhodococcus (in: high G+C Gram-positive bacteria) TaxID=192944 RepID=UPI001179C73E|nr:DUF6297 family protein [Rhodococcus sp. 1163]
MATIELARTYPSAPSIRRRVRGWRRERQPIDLGDHLTVWGLPIFVGAGLLWWLIGHESGAMSFSNALPGGAAKVEVEVGFGITMIAFAALMKAISELGPLAIGSTNRHWLYSSPVSRGALLAPRFAMSTTFGAIGGLVLVRMSTLFTTTPVPWWWCGLLGAALGAGSVGFGVVRQQDGHAATLYRVAISMIASIGAICCAGVFLSTPRVSPHVALALAVGAIVASGVGVALGAYRLRHLDAVSLSAGSDLLTALRASTTMIDGSILSAELASRTWRLMGSAPSRRFRWNGAKALIEADFRRVHRDRGAVRLLGYMCVLPYVSGATVSAAAIPVVVLLCAVTVAGRFGRGLRDMNASNTFRAVFGGSDAGIRMAHLATPAAAVSILFVVCLPILWHASVIAVTVIPVVALLALYRSTSRPPLDYGGLILETPSGQIPVDMIRQLVRGPLVVAAAAFLQLAVAM